VRSIFTIFFLVVPNVKVSHCKDNTYFLISKFIFDASKGTAPFPPESKSGVPLLYDEAWYSVAKLNRYGRDENPQSYR